MKIRYYQAPTSTSPRPAGPQTSAGWDALMDRAIARATEKSDRRLAGLLKARQDSRSEKVLRAMGILSETDIRREFPD
jgi:hypothetical protein